MPDAWVAHLLKLVQAQVDNPAVAEAWATGKRVEFKLQIEVFDGKGEKVTQNLSLELKELTCQ